MESEREVVARALCKHDKRDPDDRGPYECPAWKAYEDDAGIAIAALDALRAAPGDVEAMAREFANITGRHTLGNDDWAFIRHVLQRIAAAVAAEREQIATWHEKERLAHIESEEFWTRTVTRLVEHPSAIHHRNCADWHRRAAAAIRAGAPGHE